MAARPLKISAVDLFCGVGGLSYGLRESGIHIAAGLDLDPACAYPFRTNLQAPFHQRDVCDLEAGELAAMWPDDTRIRILAGCAPCQPFSSYRRGVDTSQERQWPLVNEVRRLIEGTMPEIVTMENVPRIGSASVFKDFVIQLRTLGYHVDFKSCHCPTYGVPQHRRRLVLLASLLGEIKVPKGTVSPSEYATVRQAIHDLPPVAHGETHPHDRFHKSRTLSETNFERIQKSTPGGTWEEWPEELRAPCHRKESGSTFRNVYARMAWDEPSPTITTMSYNFGTGRFGHPEQDRALTLREAANLQSFPSDYEFVAPNKPVQFAPLGRLIGNAVPPQLAKAVGAAIVDHVKTASKATKVTNKRRTGRQGKRSSIRSNATTETIPLAT
ncbi:DNA cytosine methyltransferase [Saccharothrix yanglingensis]|uniref:DNA (cytosine-5-)-methyltransferase n=1 Tax=Saccharothrix yanglingensis TaxID=659496 RepID=A0ABU0X5B2_9PSEU|nr:DNA cytosine methyltransferase [Saccharothrix yanglingensis]MDQ2587305.1 DNA (cytosine-5-)-methyltransferase [Saccharothrix yanglingensis]